MFIYLCLYLFNIFTRHQLEGEERPPTWLVVVVLLSLLNGARQDAPRSAGPPRRRGRRLGVKSLAAGAPR